MNIAEKLDMEMDTTKILERFSQVNDLMRERALNHDVEGSFVQDNYDDLRSRKLFSVAIPQELGGAGIPYSQLADVVKDMAGACGSTSLSYAMHTHPVLLNVFKYQNLNDEKAKATLTKIAENELIIAGTGANDWLFSNGTAEKTEGGYIVNAHKRFVSGGPGAQVFVTSAVYASEDGAQVLHFSIPFAAEGIEIQSNWDTLGMRATGSNDVIMTNVFVPDAAIVAQRPAGQWHPMWDMIIPIAMPVIVSCYLGLAEKAVDIVLEQSKGRPEKANEVGGVINQLRTAQLARKAMVDAGQELNFTPSLENTEAILSYKTIATNAIHNSVNGAANLAGGPGFFKGNEIERIMRDVRALHFHPLPEAKQVQVSGRFALELNPF